jgi:hypothetical protein
MKKSYELGPDARLRKKSERAPVITDVPGKDMRLTCV